MMMELDTILCGDSLNVLKALPEGSVHCCVTSPPYYGLRDYGMDARAGSHAGGIHFAADSGIPRGAPGAAPGWDLVGKYRGQLLWHRQQR